MSLVTASCAICGGTDFEAVFPSTITDEDRDAADFFSSSRAVAEHPPVVRCRHCGLLLTSPRDDNETLGRVYEALADASYEAEEANRRAVAAERVRLIARMVPTPGRMLDVGCSTGVFLAEAQRSGWIVTGLEASAWAAERAEARLGAPVVRGLIEDGNFSPGSFDVVTLWDVLEHLPEPGVAIQRVGTWLTPGGVLVLNIPNSASLVARLLGKRWMLLLREHLWYFSPNTITAFLASRGFTVQLVQPNFVRFSLGTIAQRLRQYRSTPRPEEAQTLRGTLARQSLRFPIGEMTVVARRTD